MFEFTNWSLRIFGISGIIGALMLLLGDQLYEHVPGSIKDFEDINKMQERRLSNGGIWGLISNWFTPASMQVFTTNMSMVSEKRLISGGTLGLFGCWFYTLGSLHLYIAFRPMGDLFASIIFLAIAATMICFGIVHTSYFAIAAGAQTAVKLGSDAKTGGKLGNIFFLTLLGITVFPAVLSSLMMIYGILGGQSLYPRWMFICVPMLLYFFKIPLTEITTGRLQEFLNESYENFVLFIFYSLSTLVLWNALSS